MKYNIVVQSGNNFFLLTSKAGGIVYYDSKEELLESWKQIFSDSASVVFKMLRPVAIQELESAGRKFSDFWMPPFDIVNIYPLTYKMLQGIPVGLPVSSKILGLEEFEIIPALEGAPIAANLQGFSEN
jgi:hypothetical protein